MLKNKKYSTQLGFGLVELMVSVSLVVLVTSVILARHDSYNGAVLLRSQAYDVALKVREVQMEAVSVVSQEGAYRTALGVCFNTSSPNEYHIFRDADDNKECDSGEYVGQRGNIDPRFQISSINLISTSIQPRSEQEIVILFERPNFDARFFVEGIEQTAFESVEIGILRVGANVQSTNVSDLKIMEISRTGQILVKSAQNNDESIELPGNPES